MKFLSIIGNSFGCSASGERLVSAARDGDLQEAKALLEYNPRLAKYSTFGVRNSPLHYSAAQGHCEIVSLLLESGVDINLRNYRGQTALMQACLYGHWEVVQTLVLFKANIHKMDYLNGSTALHCAALNGHTRCIRLLLADYVPSTPAFWNSLQRGLKNKDHLIDNDQSVLLKITNASADGGITGLHLAALNGHVDCVRLLLDLGACMFKTTVEDGSTIDLIGVGSTPLHYAACGGNAQCCQVLINYGASLTAVNANGYTPLMVSRSWHKYYLESVLSKEPEGQTWSLPSPYLSRPLMSIVKIARECGWRKSDSLSPGDDPCAVCLERKCTVAAGGCGHEFCTLCALYLCSTNNTFVISPGSPGSIACPLCRDAIVSFVKLPGTHSIKEMTRMTLPLSFCTSCSGKDFVSIPTLCKPDSLSARISDLERLPSIQRSSSFCLGVRSSPSTGPNNTRRVQNLSNRSPRPTFQTESQRDNNRRSCFSFG